jgi:murein DD-endopeptidase MepM/ murein hydrolase activator NlpD
MKIRKKVRRYLFITLLNIVGIASIVWVYTRYNITRQTVEVVATDTIVTKPEYLYNLPKESFNITSSVVRRNEYLSDILLAQGLNYFTIDQMVKVSRPVFDFRRMKEGNKYTCFFHNDSIGNLAHFVYEINTTEFITISMGDSLQVSTGKKEIETLQKTASGQINSSLWNALQENNLPPSLAIELSEIYAWTVDFFAIEKGDYFKVLYDEEYVDNSSIGVGKIHAALFSHHGKPYYAFNFEQNGSWDYFDENGQSLRKAFLKSPLTFARISSRFSNSRFHPVLKIRRPHHGIDYAAPTGTPVHTIGDGRVIMKGWSGGGGNTLKIKHNSVYTTVYMHLSGYAKNLSTGDQVRQGQLIGYVGSTGLSTGPHLDFRVYKNGSPVDPLKVEAPPVDPVKPEQMEVYRQFTVPLQQKVDSIILLKKK